MDARRGAFRCGLWCWCVALVEVVREATGGALRRRTVALRALRAVEEATADGGRLGELGLLAQELEFPPLSHS